MDTKVCGASVERSLRLGSMRWPVLPTSQHGWDSTIDNLKTKVGNGLLCSSVAKYSLAVCNMLVEQDGVGGRYAQLKALKICSPPAGWGF